MIVECFFATKTLTRESRSTEYRGDKMIAEEEEARGAKGVESRGRSPVIGGGRRR